MVGYTRQEAANIVDDGTIEASHFNNEYNALVNAFAALTGHAHDGTAAEGGYVPIIADADKHNYVVVNGDTVEFWIDDTGAGTPIKQFTLSDGAITPETDSDVDLGTTLKRFKDFYVDTITSGAATITAGTVAGATIVVASNTITTAASGNLTSTELNAALAELQTDIDTRATSTELSTHISDTTTHGTTGDIVGTTDTQTLTNKTLTSPDINTPDIDGGTVDGTTIGGTTPAAGSFTTVTADSATVNGNITVTGTVDGRDVATDGTKLDTLTAGDFSTIATTSTGTGVASGGNIVADTDNDTLNLVAGDDVTIVNDPATDKITISMSSGPTNAIAGPASAVDSNLVAFDGTTGKLAKDSGIALADVGDVVGPASTTDSTIPLFDGTSGKLLKDSGLTTSDLNSFAGLPLNNLGQTSGAQAIDVQADTITEIEPTAATSFSFSNFPTTSRAKLYIAIKNAGKYSLDFGNSVLFDKDYAGFPLPYQGNGITRYMPAYYAGVGGIAGGNGYSFSIYEHDSYSSRSMFIASSQTVHQLLLPEDYDLSKATYLGALDVTAQTSSAQGVTTYFDRYIFVLGTTSDTIYQYDPTDNGNIQTASYAAKSFAVTAQATFPNDIHFSYITSSSRKMYVLDGATDTIYQYSMSNPSDITTMSYDSKSFSVAAQTTSPTSMYLSYDGVDLFVADVYGIYQYALSTAFDISTASYVSTGYTAALRRSSTICFTRGLDRMFVGSSSDDYIGQSVLGTPGDITTAPTETDYSIHLYSQIGTFVYGLEFGDSGTKLYASSGNDIYQFTLSTAYDITTATYASKTYASAEATDSYGFRLKSDGTKLYILDNTTDTVYQYTLSTAWDISTASYDSVSKSVTTEESYPLGLEFSADGSKMYVCGGTDAVYQYTLSTPWDLSTASYASKSFSPGIGDLRCISFNSDGSLLYLGGNGGEILQSTLSVAYDISTASVDKMIPTELSGLQVYGVTMAKDGNDDLLVYGSYSGASSLKLSSTSLVSLTQNGTGTLLATVEDY